MCFIVLFHSSGDHRDLHSFPTRRSSDLPGNVVLTVTGTAGSLVWSGTNGTAWDAGTTNWLNGSRSEEHTSELQSHHDLVCRLLLEKKKEIDRILTNVRTGAQLAQALAVV